MNEIPFGFGSRRRGNEDTNEHNNPLDESDYMGQFVHAAANNVPPVLGVLSRIAGGYAFFRPYIIEEPNKQACLVDDKTTRLTLPLSLIMPQKCTPKQYVEIYNANLKHRKKTRRK